MSLEDRATLLKKLEAALEAKLLQRDLLPSGASTTASSSPRVATPISLAATLSPTEKTPTSSEASPVAPMTAWLPALLEHQQGVHGETRSQPQGNGSSVAMNSGNNGFYPGSWVATAWLARQQLATSGLRSACRPPPGLADEESVMPWGQNAATLSLAPPVSPSSDPENDDEEEDSSAEWASSARKRTLVLCYFPRLATEADICEAFDSALGKPDCISRSRIIRNSLGHGCYAFYEFCDVSTSELALEACLRGQVVQDDDVGHTWHIRASSSRRATVGKQHNASTSRRRGRGHRGGRGSRKGAAVRNNKDDLVADEGDADFSASRPMNFIAKDLIAELDK